MRAQDEMLIRVQREWDGWRTAEVRLGNLQNIHWLQPSRAPHPIVHGYILCTDIVSGNIPHDCDRTPPPHRLLVCVLKRHSSASAHAEIARRADEQQALRRNALRADVPHRPTSLLPIGRR